MKKGLIALLALILLTSFGGYSLAQSSAQNPCGGQMMGQTHMGGQGMGHMGGKGMMSHSMMGQMGPGMGMMGPMMGSPEIMGTMMSIHGEMMTLMGQMMEKYGASMGVMTPEIKKEMGKDMMERLGEILMKYGRRLKDRASTIGK